VLLLFGVWVRWTGPASGCCRGFKPRAATKKFVAVVAAAARSGVVARVRASLSSSFSSLSFRSKPAHSGQSKTPSQQTAAQAAAAGRSLHASRSLWSRRHNLRDMGMDSGAKQPTALNNPLGGRGRGRSHHQQQQQRREGGPRARVCARAPHSQPEAGQKRAPLCMALRWFQLRLCLAMAWLWWIWRHLFPRAGRQGVCVVDEFCTLAHAPAEIACQHCRIGGHRSTCKRQDAAAVGRGGVHWGQSKPFSTGLRARFAGVDQSGQPLGGGRGGLPIISIYYL
jgi:hypothetical protein